MRDRLVHGTGYWAWRAAAVLAQRLPAWVSYRAAIAGGEMAYLLWPKRRRIAKENLAVVLARPPQDVEVARIARRSFRNFAKYLVEIMRFPRLRMDELQRMVAIDPRSWSNLRTAREHGRGVIFVSLHFGNFEMGGARIADEMPLNVISS